MVTEQRIGRQVSQLSGEFVTSPIDVPFAPGFNLEALKALDPDPFFAVVKIKPGNGNGGKGPNYTEDIMRSLAEQINAKKPSGYRGHQDPDRVEYEWREPVTAWVGAVFNEMDRSLYVKGYVPVGAADLRQQLALSGAGADVINSVSVWGMRKVKDDVVTAYDLWSIDWTPKGRAGMDAELVSISGEQQQQQQEVQVERSEVLASLKVEEIPDAVKAQLVGTIQLELDRYKAAIGRLGVILSVGESADPDVLVTKVAELIETDKVEELEDRIEEKVLATVSGELMQLAVIERVKSRAKTGATDDELIGEITAAQELPHIKVLGGQSVPTVVGTGNSTDNRQGTSWEE